MACIQEIDEYPRVLSDGVMLPRSYRVAETTEGEDRIDRFVNCALPRLVLSAWNRASSTGSNIRTRTRMRRRQNRAMQSR